MEDMLIKLSYRSLISRTNSDQLFPKIFLFVLHSVVYNSSSLLFKFPMIANKSELCHKKSPCIVIRRNNCLLFVRCLIEPGNCHENDKSVTGCMMLRPEVSIIHFV